jgi:hypothetical protein
MLSTMKELTGFGCHARHVAVARVDEKMDFWPFMRRNLEKVRDIESALGGACEWPVWLD